MQIESLRNLLNTESEKRDKDWLTSIVEIVSKIPLEVAKNRILQDASGFGYFQLKIPTLGKKILSTQFTDIIIPVTQKGLGLVFVDGEAPFLYLRYGLLWEIRQTGKLKIVDSIQTEGFNQVIAGRDSRVFLGEPTRTDLPSWARTTLKRYFKQSMKIKNPKVLVLTDPKSNVIKDEQIHRAFIFSIFKENFKSNDEFESQIQLLQWFLPCSSQLVTLPKDHAWVELMTPL